MTTKEIITELEKLGSEQTKKTLLKHGAVEPIFGVKVGDLKPLQKNLKKDYKLSLELFDTGISDAMYLAGLIADEKLMTKSDLNKWVKKASWNMISEYTVPWIAAESKFGLELGLEWIESKEEKIASSGWNTLSSYLSITPNEHIDSNIFEKLLKRVEKEIHKSPNRVIYCMNMFLVSCGSYVPSLTQKAKDCANKIGLVVVDMKGTACKVPSAIDYISKIEKMNRIGVKKKMARC